MRREDRSTLAVADAIEPSRHFRRHVEPARFEHQRHDGKAREQVASGRCGRFPQPVMRRQIAVAAPSSPSRPASSSKCCASSAATSTQSSKNARGRPSLAEPSDQIPGEIDRVQLDMGEGMKQRDAPARDPNARRFGISLGGRSNGRSGRAGRGRRRCLPDRQRTCAPRRRQAHGSPRPWRHGSAVPRIAAPRRSKAAERRQSACTAFSTSATWPGTLTLCQTPRTTPFPSIR